jgi:hypothetical protein
MEVTVVIFNNIGADVDVIALMRRDEYEALRDVFAVAFDGMPTEEPMFSLACKVNQAMQNYELRQQAAAE